MCTMPKKDILEAFGQKVRALRNEREWFQEEFADKADLDRIYIGGIERGERNDALRNFKKIAETFGMTIAELAEGIE